MDPGFGPLDPLVAASRVVLTGTGVTSYVVEDGPQAGQVRITGGVLTAVTFLDGAGAMLFEVTGLTGRLPSFMTLIGRGDSSGAWAMLSAAGAKIVGSLSAAGPDHSGTGDVIQTTLGADSVEAWGGDDFVQDNGGADAYFGGAGFDTLSYEGWNFKPWQMIEGINVDQLLGTVTGPDGMVDTVNGFEDVVGTLLADTLRGNASANQFEGGAGADTIDGRGGADLVSYARDAEWGGTDGIRVNLATNTARDGFGFTDRLRNVEKIIGTAVRDTFLDSGADNWFHGGAGNDTLKFTGGNDYAIGGLGADSFVFTGTFADDVIEDFSRAEGDKVKITEATSFAEIMLVTIATDQGPAALAMYNGFSVTFLGLSAEQLAAEDFSF